MRTPPVLLLAILTALAVSAPATAKEVSKVQLCGASGCVSLPRDVARSDAFMQGGSVAEPPARAAAWYAIRYTISPAEGEDIEPFAFRNAYVPSADRLRERAEGGGFEWFEPPRDLVRALAPYLARVDAYPASRLRGLDVAVPGAAQAGAPPAPDVPSAGAHDSAPWGRLVLAAGVGASLLALLIGVARHRRAPGGSVAT